MWFGLISKKNKLQSPAGKTMAATDRQTGSSGQHDAPGTPLSARPAPQNRFEPDSWATVAAHRKLQLSLSTRGRAIRWVVNKKHARFLKSLSLEILWPEPVPLKIEIFPNKQKKQSPHRPRFFKKPEWAHTQEPFGNMVRQKWMSHLPQTEGTA